MAKRKKSNGQAEPEAAGASAENLAELEQAEAEQVTPRENPLDKPWTVDPERVTAIAAWMCGNKEGDLSAELQDILEDRNANLGPGWSWAPQVGPRGRWALTKEGMSAALDFNPETGEAHEQTANAEHMAEQLAKVDYFKREIDVELSSDERLAAACEWAKVCESQDLLKAEKAEAMSSFKDRMGALNTRAAELRGLVQRGKEKRGVECISYEDHRLGELVIKRRDTGEIIERRALTAQERQLTLDIQEPTEDEDRGDEAGGEDEGSESPDYGLSGPDDEDLAAELAAPLM